MLTHSYHYIHVWRSFSFPDQPQRLVAGCDHFVGGATRASVEAELAALVDWLVDNAEEVVLVLLVVLAVVLEGLGCVALGCGLVLDHCLLLDGLKRRRSVEFLRFLGVLNDVS